MRKSEGKTPIEII